MQSTQPNLTQPGILAAETKLARYLAFTIDFEADVTETLESLVTYIDISNTLIGIGDSLVKFLGKDVPGLVPLPAQVGSGIEIPSTPTALWCWLRGSDRGVIFHRSRLIESMLVPAFALSYMIDSFQYDENRDLSGYVDGP